LIQQPTPYNAHFLIPATETELQIKVKNIKNKNEFFNQLIKDYFDGKLDNTKSNRDNLKDEKLNQEVLKLKIQNKIALIHDLHKSPEEAIAIMNDPTSFKVDDMPIQNQSGVSSKQWDFVYGCLIDGWGLEGRLRTCTVCQFDCGHTDELARKHLMSCEDAKHKSEIQKALRGMVN